MSGKVNWRKALPELETYEDELLSAHTSFRIGGAAKWILCPKNVREAAEILEICNENDIKPFFFGNGSNILALDEGYGGVILSSARLDGVTVNGDEIVAESGVSLAKLATFAAQNELTGLEFAQGIPGSVGGGVRMNAGAYGGEIGNLVVWVETLDKGGKIRRIAAERCEFSYRNTLFCREELFITAVKFALKPGRIEEIRKQMEEFSKQRREKQPLEYPSAGSTFKRPEGHFAAALIDQCGLKGLQIGGAQVSEKHAGFVVNRGNATAADVLAVMETVRRTVAEKTGVSLEPEVEILR